MNFKIKLYKLPNEHTVSNEIVVTRKQLKEIEKKAEENNTLKYRIEVLEEVKERMKYKDLVEIGNFV
jgi:hypothetical protein